MLDQLLRKRYQVLQVLSQGIFCETYIAQDTNLAYDHICVVKHFLPSNKCTIPIEIRRRLFKREVEALKRLGNYDLVPHLLNHFEDNLEFYLVQEFIEGHPLSAELPPGCRWSESKVFQLLQEILKILHFVHHHGLIHRDVKPSNILRRKQDNQLVLIDFGAVKPILSQLVTEQQKTSDFIHPDQYTTISIGTPGYMPNEQVRGRPRPSSDIYALGMIGIQALTGVHPTQLPEDRNTGEIIWQHQAQVSTALASILKKMVRYHFQDRYKSAREVLEALMPLSNLYEPIEKSYYTPPLEDVTRTPQTLSFGQDTNQFDEGKVSAPDDQTSNTTISYFPSKSALLTGLVLGVVSGLILMLVSYWCVQMISPTPKIQNFQIQPSRDSH